MSNDLKLISMSDFSPYREAAPSLYKMGYSVLPVAYETKRPTITEWSAYCNERPTKDYLKTWYNVPKLNIGVTLGKASGIVALDFDYDLDNLHEKIKEIAGKLVVCKKAKRGFTAFFRFNNEISRSWKKDGQVIIELLSTGRQTVVPPSKHPSGCVFEYTTESTLENTSADQLPYLPSDFEDQLNALFNVNTNIKSTDKSEHRDVELDEVVQAMEFISPEVYDIWLAVGQGLKDTFGDAAFPAWETWTSSYFDKNPESKRFGHLEYKWNSFKKSGIGVGTIFHYAIENGYRFNNVSNTKVDEYKIENILETLKTWREKGKPVGVRSGIRPLDNLLKWRRGELTVVTGYPGSGKSEFIDFLIYNHLITNNYKTLLVSFEGSGVASHVDSYLQRITGKTFEERTEQEDKLAFNKIQNNLFFYDASISSHDIDKVVEYAEKKEIDFLVIDPFNWLTSQCTDQVYMHVRYVLKKLKMLCKKTNCMVLLIAHPKSKRDFTKDGEPTPCNVWDIAGGFDFWNMSDNALVIKRDSVKTNDIVVSIQKVKIQDTDCLGSFGMEFNKSTRLYKETQVEWSNL